MENNDRARDRSPKPLQEVFRAGWERTVPSGTSFLHYLGALVLLFFIVEIATGILLMVYYRPGAAAHYSTGIIMGEVRLGWLVRSLHRWGSDLVILLLLLHMIRVYFSRSYQPPRHLNWIVGILLLVLALALGFTGTLLPADQYAYWYTDSARRSIADVPVFGNLLLGLFWGGWEIGEEVLLRFYAFHVGILPWLAACFLAVHFLLVWRLGIKQPLRVRKSPAASPTPFFPDFLLNLLMSALLIGGLLLSAAVLIPAPLLEPADPLSPLAHPQPPWYLLVIRGLVGRLPGWAAAASAAAFFLLLSLVPFLDRRSEQPTWKKALQRGLGIVVIAAWVHLSIRAYLQQ